MSTIWMDPVELKASATTLAENAMQIQETMTGTRTTCACEVPRSLIGWLDEELQAITVAALQVAVGYLEQALDVAQRGHQIQADQSLVTASPPLGAVVGGTSFMTTASLSDVLVGAGSIVGGTSFTSGIETQSLLGGTMTIGGPGSREAFLANNPLLAAAENLQNRNPAAAAQLMGLQSNLNQSNDNMIKTWLAPQGLSFVGGNIYADESGRQGTLSQTYRNRRDGDLEF